MSDIVITNDMVATLRESIKPYLKPKRYLHTLAVEKEAVALGELFFDESKLPYLRAAALLHDITKMLSSDKQLQLYEKFGIISGDEDAKAPKLFHAKTAAALISEDFPEFANDEVVNGVRWHTTGHKDMSIFEAVIYLADYIEETRTFDDCIILRRLFWEKAEKCEKKEELLSHLYETMVVSFDMTMKCLINEGGLIDRDTVEARNYFLLKTAKPSGVTNE